VNFQLVPMFVVKLKLTNEEQINNQQLLDY